MYDDEPEASQQIQSTFLFGNHALFVKLAVSSAPTEDDKTPELLEQLFVYTLALIVRMPCTSEHIPYISTFIQNFFIYY